MTPPVLVTGGAGFIGANLVRLLLEEGYGVRVLDSFEAGRRDYLEGLETEVLQGDVLDEAMVRRSVEGAGSVVHLAAQTGVPGSLADPVRDRRVNIAGTMNLLEACRALDASAPFVFASSNAPLGRQPPPATEDKAPLPISPYGASKLAGEAYCLAYHGSWGLPATALRFGNVYGPFSAHKDSVVARFFKDIRERGEITVDGHGAQTRDFIYVDDLCRAVVKALEVGEEAAGEVFQIATGVETSINDLARMVTDVVGRDVRVEHGPPRRGDVAKNYSVIAKARGMLAWEPRVELEEGLRKSWEWFREYDRD